MRKPAKFKYILLTLGTAVFVGLAGAWFLFPVMFPRAQAQMPPGMDGPMPVKVQVAKRDNVRIWKEFPGRLVAVNAAQIRPEVSGRITEVNFEDGDNVEKDAVLFVIDPRPYEANLAQAKAALQVAQSHYNLANIEFERAEGLIASNAISQRILDERKSARNSALAEINAAKAQIEKAEIDLDHAHVKAPIAGRASRAEITVGNLVEAGPNAPILTSIVADAKIYADFEVDEGTYISYVRGQAQNKEQEGRIPVEIVLRGDEENPIHGEIHTFDNRINPATGTIRARAIIKNEDGSMLPGMFAKVRLGSAEREEQILINENAIGTDQDRKFVYTVEEGKVTYKPIQIGTRTGQSRVILAGLNEGDQVIAEGIFKIRPGMPVKPMPMNADEGQNAAAPRQAAPETAPETPQEPTQETAQDIAPQDQEPAANGPQE